MREILTVDGVTARYQTPDGELTAAEGVSLRVREGEFVSLVGPSGYGKSTLLSMMAGLKAPSAGRVLLDGEPVTGPSSKVGYMLQRDALLDWRTVYKNVLLGLEIRRQVTAESLSYAEQLLRTYGLWEFRDRRPAELSGGMRQRVALIRTLAIRPEIFLLDEAFSALDYRTDAKLRGGLANQLQNTTRMIVAQRIGTIRDADKIIVLDEGRMVGIGTHEELMKSCPVYQEIARSQLSSEELGA